MEESRRNVGRQSAVALPAVEIALKMNFHSWRDAGHTSKQEFICLKGGHRGGTLGDLEVTDAKAFRDAYAKQLMASWLPLSPA